MKSGCLPASENPEREDPLLVQSIINALPVPIFVKDSKGLYVYCNIPFEKYVGKEIGELIGKGVYELWDRELAEIYSEADRRLFDSGGEEQYEARVKYADGSVRDVIFHKAVFSSGTEHYMAGAILDITARKLAEAELEKIALTDTLTGAASRYHLYATLDDACRKASRQHCSVALMSIDLDEFKSINDTLGHLAGDSALVEAARRIRSSIRESDTLARLGGDEFVVVLEDIEKKESVFSLAESILKRLADDMDLGGKKVRLGASIGIAFYPEQGRDPEALLHQADLALYSSKAQGKARFSTLDP